MSSFIDFMESVLDMIGVIDYVKLTLQRLEINMTEPQAKRRYFKIFVPSMAIYLASLFGISFYAKQADMPQPLLYALCLIPVGALLGWMWAQWRYVNELDEYLKMIQIKGILFGLAVVLAISASWGLMEVLADVPTLKVFHVVTIFCFATGPAIGFLTWRERKVSA